MIRPGESPHIGPFLDNNGDEALKRPSSIICLEIDRYGDFLLYINVNRFGISD